jgi:ABC-type methionine transport system permease subunit
LFSLEELVKIDKGIFKKHRLFSGILLLFLGVYLIWSNILNSLSRYLPNEVYNAIYSITRVAPQIILGVAIIAVGAKLISGKKKEFDSND